MIYCCLYIHLLFLDFDTSDPIFAWDWAGNKPSGTGQPFLSLHLDIYPEAVRTIEDALRLFSAPETLEGYRPSAAGKVYFCIARIYKILLLCSPACMILNAIAFFLLLFLPLEMFVLCCKSKQMLAFYPSF